MKPTEVVSHDTPAGPATPGPPATAPYDTSGGATSCNTVCVLPIAQEWQLDLAPTGSASRVARVHARTCLTVLGWRGRNHAAIAITDRLVRNAVAYGGRYDGQPAPIRLRLAVTEKGQLLIEVSDSNPSFPNFADAVLGERGQGLWEISRMGGHLSWFLPQSMNGKTVRALVAPGPVSP
ncbi:ATP-binding protein [Streptomyces sp. NPDC091416]|uniref:ATP-binding protein n=1 Tax=Streptomyces sp. NPDC091416 TaxID=3366003 RepID=UPI00380846A9